jgi:TfoX/Sxy family transcriptional regulator of competence genes
LKEFNNLGDMAYSEKLEKRMDQWFEGKGIEVKSKKMFGGLCYLVNDKMLAGISGDRLMARIDPDIYEEALTRPGASVMDFTGRTMKGYVYVDYDGMGSDEGLEEWIVLCLDYNPKAKSSKKKKKK